MTISSTPSPPVSGCRPIGPHTLASIAAALATCHHPVPSRVSAELIWSDKPLRITWCAICGAVRSDESGIETWQPSALVTLLGEGHFSELGHVVRALRKCCTLLDSFVSTGQPQPPAAALLLELRSTLSEVARSASIRQLDRLDTAIEVMSRRPPLVT